MKHDKIKNRVKTFIGQLLETVKNSPGESILVGMFLIITTLVIEDVEFFDGEYQLLYPLFFTFTFLLNRRFPSGAWRWVYRLSPLAAIPFLWVSVDQWVESTAYFIAVAICPFAVFCGRLRRGNESFVADALHYVKNALFAGMLSGAAFGLLAAIYFSLKYIFPGLPLGDEDKAVSYFAAFSFVAMLPLTFLTFDRRQKDEYRPVAFFDTLANYVLAPALLAYTAILYAYFLKILVTWSLPKGGIAYMVFGFTLVAVAVKAYRLLVARRLYDWFFDRFSLISLPALAMFWIGTCYRIGQYGLTEERFYLVVSGAVMTFVVLAFLAPRVGHYLYATLLAIGLFAVFTFIPAISADSIALRSQTRHFETAAARLGMLGPDGKLTGRKAPPADSLDVRDYENLYSAFEYLSNHSADSVLTARYGYPSAYEFSEEMMPDNIRYGRFDDDDAVARNGNIRRRSAPLDLRGFSWMHDVEYGHGQKGYSYVTENNSLRLYGPDTTLLFEVAFEEVLARQLAKTGLTDSATIAEVEARADEFLLYDHDALRLTFSSVSLNRDSVLTIGDISVGWLLERE